MNGLIDAHCHLQDEKLKGTVGVVIDRAREAGINKVVCCGTCESDWQGVSVLYEKYIETVIPSFGLHPWFVKECSDDWADILEGYLQRILSAVGEIGLDFAIDEPETELQKRVFREQLELAKKYRRPVSIHCRRAWEGLLEVLRDVGPVESGGIVHSYSGSSDILSRLLEYNLSISFSGSITRSGNKRGRKALSALPLDKLLIETDSPDLLPVGVEPPNEPSNLLLVVNAVSQILDIPEKEIECVTSRNAYDIFGKLTID